jgi:hypothetical protein
MGFAGIKTSAIIPTDEEKRFIMLIVKHIKNCKNLPWQNKTTVQSPPPTP